jgi:hypothetical protein
VLEAAAIVVVLVLELIFVEDKQKACTPYVCAHKRHDVGCSVLYFFWGVTLELMYVVLIQQTKALKAKEEWKGAVEAS